MGRGNAVMVDGNDVKYGASDPRADGQAVPQNPDYWTDKTTSARQFTRVH
jgi:hypothetical protein